MSWEFELLTPETSGLTEGPAWDGSGLIYTNIPNSRILRYDPASGAISEFRTGTNNANGLMFDQAGQLYACESGSRRIVRYEAGGGVTVICDHFEGKRLNSPNDLAVDTQGRIWFTDPRYGDFRDDMELDHESVYRLDPQADGSWSITRMTFDVTCPNGLLITPDCSTLYVAQSKYGEGQLRELRAYPILADGSLGKYEVLHNFAPHRGIDGMCFDVDGNIVATAGWELSGPGGMIYIFAPNGRVLETHPVPANRPTNCTFGGDDMRTLFVTSIDGLVFKTPTERTGWVIYPARS
ncbi:MAG: SMP-30/gluconolactonase/LRE family protein [Caldilineaceae bacterium]|nr:SMP-30/gluconolactonase/LRE family protein [Caldilineaceae bacterium]